MTARCETIGKYVLPVFRALVAKELINTYHLTQVDVAKKLRTTQAAISHYVTSKRATPASKRFATMLPRIQAMACETAKGLAETEIGWDEVTQDFCKLCSTLYPEENSQTSDDYAI